MTTNSATIAHSFRAHSILIGLSLFYALAGCGRSISVPSTFPVKGVVKIKGKPARGIRVKLIDENESGREGFVPTGETGPDGRFQLSTGAPLNGAPAGKYFVTFERPIIDPKNPVETEIDGLGGKFNDPMSSKFVVTIVPGDNSLPVFELD